MNIILYLLQIIQYLYQQNCWLINFICKYIPLKQWIFDDSNSPKYQKFKIDELPKIISFKQEWNWTDLISYYQERYNKTIKPVFRHGECTIPESCTCTQCNAPYKYLSWNDGKKQKQLRCKVCQSLFTTESEGRFAKIFVYRCPHCDNALVHKKDRKNFIVYKCVNPKCPYYIKNLKKVSKKDLDDDYGKNKYKLHYIYRSFNIDFFKENLNPLPKIASFKFSKFDKNVMGLCLTYKINLGLSLRKTQQALLDIHGIDISYQTIANYCKKAAVCIKPFTDNFDYGAGRIFTADETYIKIRGIRGYIWFIMDVAKRSIIGYRISSERDVGACILSMRMAFRHFSELPKNFRFIADGYSAYVLASQQFLREYGEKFKFNITRVIGLTNDDAVSEKYRPYKQMIERLNRTYKSSYRPTNGFNNIDGANYDLALWVTYYNFLRPHEHFHNKVLNEVEDLKCIDTMPGKWQMLIALGQQTILNLQNGEAANCS